MSSTQKLFRRRKIHRLFGPLIVSSRWQIQSPAGRKHESLFTNFPGLFYPLLCRSLMHSSPYTNARVFGVCERTKAFRGKRFLRYGQSPFSNKHALLLLSRVRVPCLNVQTVCGRSLKSRDSSHLEVGEALDTANPSQSDEHAKVSDAVLLESSSEARPERTERRTHPGGRRNEAT